MKVFVNGICILGNVFVTFKLKLTESVVKVFSAKCVT